MLALSPSRRARIRARITSLNTQITALETAIETTVSKDVKEYSFNSGDGSQRAVNRSITEMQRELDVLYRQLEFQHNLLRGRGLVQMKMVRR